MRIGAEISTRPGAKTLLVAELKIEKAESVSQWHGWWGLWFTFWLYKPRYWREMLWAVELEHRGVLAQTHGPVARIRDHVAEKNEGMKDQPGTWTRRNGPRSLWAGRR